MQVVRSAVANPGVPLGAWVGTLRALARSILRYVPSSLGQAFRSHAAWLIVKRYAAAGTPDFVALRAGFTARVTRLSVQIALTQRPAATWGATS